jgi:hypothetical protein
MDTKQISIKCALDAWNARMDSAQKLFDSLSDEDLLTEIAPGRNRGIYLLGHLTAVHDRMLPLLDFEAQLFPQLDEPFLNKPDKSVENIPSVPELRAQWKKVNDTLASHYAKLSADDWFKKHTSVSAEDFVKEPHRNRLNVLIGRTNHMQYHMGQVALLKKK